VVDPAAYPWGDADWNGVTLPGQVLYEMHIGTFTAEGTWAAARRELGALARLGVTVLEVMPVAEFPGRFGWGYDGVSLFAPFHRYGSPDDFRRFVDAAHGEGLAVILDVVYNHLGPDGNCLAQYSPSYFGGRVTDWGHGINFHTEGSEGVREFFLANARYWIAEFHLDGLRLDATQSIHDESADHILAAVGRAVREAAAGRRTLVIAENEPQDVRLVAPLENGGFALDGLWNDDFHHAARVALTGNREAYYRDYRGTPQELLSAAKHGYLYQGQLYRWQGKRRGTWARGLPRHTFVNYLDNHDQVGNSASGRRSHQLAGPARHRALTALLLLGPWTPLLFQGQEFAASAPFLFFADHGGELAASVRSGRRAYLAQFQSFASEEWTPRIPDPSAPETFAACRLDHAEREAHPEVYALHRDLLALRRSDPVLRQQGAGGLDGAVLGGDAFVLRYTGRDASDRLVVVNLGPDLDLDPIPEPLLAPPAEGPWSVAWSSEAAAYGGRGVVPLPPDGGWALPAECTLFLKPDAPV
jgi:maltooligosyltrehalose trehalohydrolase